jgi:hypothetical protein
MVKTAVCDIDFAMNSDRKKKQWECCRGCCDKGSIIAFRSRQISYGAQNQISGRPQLVLRSSSRFLNRRSPEKHKGRKTAVNSACSYSGHSQKLYLLWPMAVVQVCHPRDMLCPSRLQSIHALFPLLPVLWACSLSLSLHSGTSHSRHSTTSSQRQSYYLSSCPDGPSSLQCLPGTLASPGRSPALLFVTLASMKPASMPTSASRSLLATCSVTQRIPARRGLRRSSPFRMNSLWARSEKWRNRTMLGQSASLDIGMVCGTRKGNGTTKPSQASAFYTLSMVCTAFFAYNVYLCAKFTCGLTGIQAEDT